MQGIPKFDGEVSLDDAQQPNFSTLLAVKAGSEYQNHSLLLPLQHSLRATSIPPNHGALADSGLGGPYSGATSKEDGFTREVSSKNDILKHKNNTQGTDTSAFQNHISRVNQQPYTSSATRSRGYPMPLTHRQLISLLKKSKHNQATIDQWHSLKLERMSEFKRRRRAGIDAEYDLERQVLASRYQVARQNR